jgi:hypothetical protein
MGRPRVDNDETAKIRFWKHVQKTDSCWLWMGYRNPKGYGQIQVGSLDKPRAMLAHRLSWEMHRGPLDKNVPLMHRCDTPACVNPDHLLQGSRAENNADMTQKGRRWSKLTLDEALAIRTEYAQGGITMAALGRRYGIGTSQVHRIVSGQSRVTF